MRKLILFLMPILMFVSCKGAERKEINASEIIKLLKAEKNVQIIDRIIMDDLDFTMVGNEYALNSNVLQVGIESNLFFNNCIFIGKVTANGKKESLSVQSCFRKNMSFVGCDFRGTVDFNQSVVFGMVNFSKSVFRENAHFNSVAFWSKDTYFAEITAEKNFSMIYASFLGNLHLMDAEFDQNAIFQNISVNGKLSFNNSTFKGKAGFDLMEINGGAFFNYAVFEKGADFAYSRFLHTVDFIKTNFQGKGNFEKTLFLNTVRFEEVNNDNIILQDTFFGNKKIEN